jgi:glycosyltransferase involved in cell wall biosynthesis
MRISVVIPVYNGGECFKECLASIQLSLRMPDEVIVVSDGDTDGSSQMAENFGAQVIRLPDSGGPARARNIGADAAQGDIIFFVDADVTLHSDTISRVEQRFQQEQTVSAVIGSYDDTPGAENFFSQYKNLFHHYTHQQASEDASTFWGACGAIRRSVFLAVGGFNDAYTKPCVEDIELGYRLKQAGYQIFLDKGIQVKHLKRWQFGSLLRAEIFYRALPWTELLLSNRQFKADLNLSYTNRLSVLLVFLLLISLMANFFTGLRFPALWGVALVLALAILGLNWKVYRFFVARKGLGFMLCVIPWHWLYFLYSGATFTYGLVRYYLGLWQLPVPPIPHGISKVEVDSLSSKGSFYRH